MAKIETTFIRPKELYTPDTGETKVVYDGYQNNPHELVVEENLEGEVSEIVNDTFVPNEGGNVVFTDGNDVAHELITKSGLGKAQVIETTWQELKDKRDNGQLIAGSLYRITDYNCTTTQENTQSAGHQFDIVLLALSENKLAEEGWAMMHENDTYFANSNLSAWKVWYCLDNDKSRFAWADNDKAFNISYQGEDYQMVRDTSNDVQGLYAWSNDDIGTLYTNNETPQIGDNLYWQDGTLAEENELTKGIYFTGRGVIYRLIDEFNNDIKYDFKNIQFKRKLTNGQYDATNGTETWCYTLNLWYNSMCQDASIVGNTLLNDEGYISGVYGNKFGYATAYDLNIEGVNTFTFVLGNNVVLSFDNSGNYSGIHSNSIGNGFYSNTIGNVFNSNIIGNYFSNNTIGNSFGYNTTGNSFQHKNISTRLTYANYGNNGVELATKNDIGNIETALNNI